MPESAASPGDPPTSPARLSGLDAMRVLGLFAVVHAHAPQFPPLSPFIDNTFGFVVPFFFLASGYFLARAKGPALPILKRLTVRIGAPFLAWFVLYNAWPESWTLRHSTPAEIFSADHLIFLVRGGHGFHLWYLPSLLAASVLVILLRRSAVAMIAMAAALYVPGLLLGAYSQALFGWTPIWNMRDGPFFPMIFVAAGYLLAGRASWGWPLVLALLGVGYVVHMAEYLSLERAGLLVHSDFFVGTLPFGVGAFLLSLKLPSTRWLAWIGRAGTYGLGVYCAHLFLLKGALAIVTPQSTGQSLALALLVLAVTAVLVGWAAKSRLCRWALV